MAFIINPYIFGGAGYTITRALSFEDGDSDHLSRTPASASVTAGRRIWTFSFWLKRANLGGQAGEMRIFGGNANASHIYITDGDLLHWDLADDGESLNSGRLETTAVLRDTTAWYNIVCSLDTRTEVTAANRMRMWINGSEVSSFGARSNPGNNYDTNAINDATLHTIGFRHDDQGTEGMQFDGYLAEIIFLDGTAVTDASKFGELNSDGVWVPIEPDHTFGTNGFHLNFSTSHVGQDVSSGSFSENLRELGTELGSIGTDSGHPNARAAFNGTTMVVEASCARDNNATTGATIGKDWGSGNTNTITAFRVYGPQDDGFIDNTKAATIKLQGSTDNFSSSIVDLHTTASIADANKSIHSVTSGITTSTAYRYHRIIMFATDGSSNAAKVAEVEFFKAGDFGLNNFEVSSMGTNNIIVDSCTNKDDEEITLYPALDPLTKNASVNLTDSNLTHTGTDGDIDTNTKVNFPLPSTGKFYFEFVSQSSAGIYLGVVVGSCANNESGNGANKGFLYNQSNGKLYANPLTVSSGNSYGATWTTGDVIGVAIDMTNGGDLWFSKNDTWQSSATASEIAAGTTTNAAVTNMPTNTTNSRTYDGSGLFVALGDSSASGKGTLKFDSSSWTGAAPTGFGELTQTITGAGNYPTINPNLTSVGTLSNGNLSGATTSGAGVVVSFVATHAISSGKFYWEVTLTAGSSVSSRIGIATTDSVSATAPTSSIYIGQETTDDKAWAFNAWADGANDSKIEFGNGSAQRVSYGEGATSGFVARDTVGVALDMDNGALWFSKNGTWLGGSLSAGNPATISEIAAGTVTNAAVGPNSNCADNINLSSLTVVPVFTVDGVTATTTINFGQTPFRYTVPTGFKSLTTSNMATLSVSSPATGSFTGNSSTDGPFVYLGYKPDTSGTSTITEAGGSASTITWGTHARVHSNGFKIIASADDYNKSATNAYSIAIITSSQFADNNRAG